MLAAFDARLFRLQDFFVIRIFALQLADFFLDQAKAFLRGFIFFLFHRFALDLELDQATLQLVHHLWLGIDLDLDFRGRFVDQVDCPCPAESGQ